MHSPKFNDVKYYYTHINTRTGKPYWSKEKVKEAVVKKWITAEEYEEITGEPYEA